MSDYNPKHRSVVTVTVTTSDIVVGGQLLVVSGDGTVAAATGESAAYVGVSLADAISGGYVAMEARGAVHVSTASGAVTAGDQLVTASGGKVATLAAATADAAADINDARSVVGVALTSASNAATVEWMQF